MTEACEVRPAAYRSSVADRPERPPPAGRARPGSSGSRRSRRGSGSSVRSLGRRSGGGLERWCCLDCWCCWCWMVVRWGRASGDQGDRDREGQGSRVAQGDVDVADGRGPRGLGRSSGQPHLGSAPGAGVDLHRAQVDPVRLPDQLEDRLLGGEPSRPARTAPPVRYLVLLGLGVDPVEVPLTEVGTASSTSTTSCRSHPVRPARSRPGWPSHRPPSLGRTTPIATAAGPACQVNGRCPLRICP